MKEMWGFVLPAKSNRCIPLSVFWCVASGGGSARREKFGGGGLSSFLRLGLPNFLVGWFSVACIFVSLLCLCLLLSLTGFLFLVVCLRYILFAVILFIFVAFLFYFLLFCCYIVVFVFVFACPFDEHRCLHTSINHRTGHFFQHP